MRLQLIEIEDMAYRGTPKRHPRSIRMDKAIVHASKYLRVSNPDEKSTERALGVIAYASRNILEARGFQARKKRVQALQEQTQHLLESMRLTNRAKNFIAFLNIY